MMACKATNLITVLISKAPMVSCFLVASMILTVFSSGYQRQQRNA
jgi:hypothetical protein